MIADAGLTTFLTETDFSTYPYYESQKYFTSDGRVYQDKNLKRYLIGNVNIVRLEADTGTAVYTEFKGSLVLKYVDLDYILYYVGDTGALVAISGGGGGSTYTGGTNITINNVSDEIDLDITLLNMKEILFFDNDFVIAQSTDAIGTVQTDIIKIYKLNDGGTDGSKVEIKNAKTHIEDLDFGGW